MAGRNKFGTALRSCEHDDNWREPAMCPSGAVATKLVVYIRPDGKKEAFTGLSLKCQHVEVTRTCVSGC
jgi:hypothetical protein